MGFLFSHHSVPDTGSFNGSSSFPAISQDYTITEQARLESTSGDHLALPRFSKLGHLEPVAKVCVQLGSGYIQA